ncbi:glycosyltransferase family 4 protein [Ferrimonas pelagia]|uniref:Glycosyltransferase family 4 protein n=1 Tax=Ferrimonas pelagia TaxID=1177826 RepID=A0ABP9FIG8_9GAMM
MRQSTTVIIFVDARHIGGIESHVIQLINYLKGAEVPVELWLWRRYPNSRFGEQLDLHGILPMDLKGRFHLLLRRLWQQPNLVLHTHGYKAALLGRFAARLCRTPCCSTHHAGESPTGRIGLYMALDRLSARWATNFAVSQPIAAQLPVPCDVIKNFTYLPSPPTRRFSPQQPLQIGFVGRYESVKGFDRFNRLAQHDRAHYRWHSYGCGETPAIAPVQDHGPQLNMGAIWPKLDLLIMPSRAEGLPLAALEAMAAGVVVIAFDVGDLAELILPGTGWVLAEGDLAGISAAIDTYQRLSANERRAMSQCARRCIEERWSAEQACQPLLAYYGNVNA